MTIAEIAQELQKEIDFYHYTEHPEGFCQISDNGAKAALIILKQSIGLPLSREEYFIITPTDRNNTRINLNN